MHKAKDVFIRPLFKEDIPTITEAFRSIGWHKPACLFEGYLSEPRLVWVAFIGDQLAGHITPSMEVFISIITSQTFQEKAILWTTILCCGLPRN
ncbi:MAG: hypothetical protein BGO07_04015 [Alphaproteobacteria bacterium 40-19]|nr:MAG: hypothetical protein BGO07_04015 [Alphaproteobacteria bacterium 40-19]